MKMSEMIDTLSEFKDMYEGRSDILETLQDEVWNFLSYTCDLGTVPDDIVVSPQMDVYSDDMSDFIYSVMNWVDHGFGFDVELTLPDDEYIFFTVVVPVHVWENRGLWSPVTVTDIEELDGDEIEVSTVVNTCLLI